MENATAPSESSTPKPSKRTFDEMTGNSNSGLPQTRKVKLSSDISDAEVLDSEGDVVLAVKKPDSDDQNMFLVSSKVLSLASPVFEKMFSPKFLEGEQVRRGERLCNVLGDDDPEAMQIILRILHHCRHDRPFQLKEPLKLATVAIHCDKYDCSNPLDVWIRGWMGDQNLGPLGICTAEGIGLLLVAAYMFRRNNAFLSSFGSRASKFLMPGFVSVWKQNELISLLPEAFTTTLSNNVSDKLCRVQNAFHAAEETLRQRSKGFVIPGHLVCPPCDLGYKSQIRKCSCGLFLIPKYCTFDYRFMEYFIVISRAGIALSVKGFSNQPIHSIDPQISDSVRQTQLKHRCEGLDKCPLLVALATLRDTVKAIRMEMNVIWIRT